MQDRSDKGPRSRAEEGHWILRNTMYVIWLLRGHCQLVGGRGAEGHADLLSSEWTVLCIMLCTYILFSLPAPSSFLSNSTGLHTGSNFISVKWLSPVFLGKSHTHLWPIYTLVHMCTSHCSCVYDNLLIHLSNDPPIINTCSLHESICTFSTYTIIVIFIFLYVSVLLNFL